MVAVTAVLVWGTVLLVFKAILTCPSKDTFLHVVLAGSDYLG